MNSRHVSLPLPFFRIATVQKRCLVLIFLGLASVVSGCGGGSSTPQNPPPTPQNLSVSPTSANLLLGNTQQFAASISGVNWTVNGVSGGNSTVGTISGTGLYTAPVDLPSNLTVTVTATSSGSQSSSASVNISSDVTVTVATNPPGSVSVPTGSPIALVANISSAGHPDTSVSWAVNGIAGGNGQIGTITTAGMYAAPPSLPNPPSVTLTATSVADPSKSASVALTIAGTIASTTMAISASVGGAISLPDGSNVTIPPTALASDQMVSLSEITVLPKQPPNAHITSTGTGLVLSLSTPNPKSSSRALRDSTRANATTPANSPDLLFTIVEPPYSSNSLQGSAPLSDLVDSSGDNFTGASGSLTGSTAQYMIPSTLLGGVSSVAVSQANTVAEPPGQYGPRSLSGSKWTSYSCPAGSVLVLVHGMASSVEKAFPADSGCAGKVQANGAYDQVIGFNYDWTQDIDQSGGQLATFLDTAVAQCSGIRQIDIEAHSEGTPVSISAGGQVNPSTQLMIKHFVFIGGPVLGTPIASSAQNFFTGLFNLPGLENNLPLLQEYGAFTNGLTPGSSELSTDRAKFATNLPNVMVIEGAGNVPDLPPLSDLSAFSLGTPNDGIIPTGSAVPSGSGLPNERQLPVFADSHTQLECDSRVQSAVGAQLALDVHPTQLTFVSAGGKNPPNQTLTLDNPGKAIAWVAVATTTGSGSWLAVSPTSGDTQNNGSVTVSVDVSKLSAGSYSGSIGFTATPNMNLSMSTQVPVTLTVSSQTFSGTFTGTVMSDPNGPCPGSATESGTISATLAPTGDPQVPFGLNVTWNMTQASGICHDYSGTYNLIGGVDPSGNVNFAFANPSGSFAIGGMGTLSNGTLAGTWQLSGEYTGSTCNQNLCADVVIGGSFTMQMVP